MAAGEIAAPEGGERTNEGTGAGATPWFVRSPSAQSSRGRRALTAEAVVIVAGGVVVGDDGQGVGEERAEVVDAAAHALAVGPAVALAAVRPVVRDRRSAEKHRAARDIDTATKAVAAVGAVTARGLVMADGGIENGGSAVADIEAAAQAVAAIGPAFTVMAEGQVVRQAAAQDGEAAGAGNAAACTQTGAAGAASGGAASGFIVADGAVQDREDGRGAEVGRDGGRPSAEKASAQAVAAL